jgi:5,10-methylenetetrahydromethanopterin reductase
MTVPSIGIMYQRDFAPELLRERARRFESLGLDDWWVVEDLTFAGGIATAATVLEVTDRITVGLGILPAVVRNPLFAAMEIAALIRLHPGRVLPGIGHGMQDWMGLAGGRVSSPVQLLEETLTAVRRLLDGETVSMAGRYVNLDGVKLAFPPEHRPPLLAGVRGPKSIAAAGRVADGLILAEPTSPAYVRWAREQFQSAASQAGRAEPIVVAYTWLSIADDVAVARDRVRPFLASIPGGLSEPSVRPHILALEFGAELMHVLEQNPDQESRGRALAPEWVDQLAVVGTPADCAACIRRLAAAGADRVAMVPLPDRFDEQVALLAGSVLPLLKEDSAQHHW